MEKKLDDHEDRRNPQCIPKRGTFYEHDDRTTVEDVGENETSEKEAAERAAKEGQTNERTKKVWREHENRWSHDHYNEDEQAPKSREELIAIYGYDIRNEEGPPRDRRLRRYGTQSHGNNYKNNKEESSISNQKIHDNREGPHTIVARGVGRGRSKNNRGRGGGPGMFEGVVGIPVKTKVTTRSSSETRMPAGMAQHHESNKGSSSSTAPPAAPNPRYHTRVFFRRNNNKLLN